jgi:hypothetical protein
MGMSPDLCQLAAVETYSTGFGERDEGTNKSSGRTLDGIAIRAMDRARIHERADWGTAFHKITEPGQVAWGGHIPEGMDGDVASFNLAMRGLTILDTEFFVVYDDLFVAGSGDCLFDGDDLPAELTGGIDCSGTVVIGDKKTGRLLPQEAAPQFTTYAHGQYYDKETGKRTTFEEMYGRPANKQLAIFIHTPAGQRQTFLIGINLEEGLKALRLACQVRDWQRSNAAQGAGIDHQELARRRCIQLIQSTNDSESLSKLYEEFRDVWTNDMTELGKAQLS